MSDTESTESEVEQSIKPYQFEPKRKKVRPVSDGDATASGTANGSGDNPGPTRVKNNDWCSCGKCTARDDTETSFCCRECPQLEALRLEIDPQAKCCTDLEGVQVNGTNPHVLRAVRNGNRSKFGRKGHWSQNEMNRHVAYCNLVAYAWGYLGRYNRVPLPSCVMKMVGDAFPGDRKTGFKYADVQLL